MRIHDIEQRPADHWRDARGEAEGHAVDDECAYALAALAGSSHHRHAHGNVPAAVADAVQQIPDEEKRWMDVQREEPPEWIERQSGEGDRHQSLAAEPIA